MFKSPLGHQTPNITLAPPYDNESYSYTIFDSALPGQIAFSLPDQPANVTITVMADGYRQTTPLHFSSSYYWSHVGQQIDASFLTETLSLQPTSPPSITLTPPTIILSVVALTLTGRVISHRTRRRTN